SRCEPPACGSMNHLAPSVEPKFPELDHMHARESLAKPVVTRAAPVYPHAIASSGHVREYAMRSILASSALLLASLAHADDWPHWMGPRSDGTSGGKGNAPSWPQTGPKILWKAVGGDGYSAIAVAGDRAITMVQRDGK